jgi:hypothetical protein
VSEQASTRHVRSPWELIAAIAVVSAAGAAFSGAQPTGVTGFDIFYCALFGAFVALTAASCRRWALLPLAGLATVIGATFWGHLVGAIALGIAMNGALRSSRRDRVTGAVVGALSAQVLLRTTDVGFFGLTALLVGIAVLMVSVSAYRTMRRRNRKRVRIAVGVCVLFVAIAIIGFVVTVVTAVDSFDLAVANAKQGLTAAVSGNQTSAKSNWDQANRSFLSADAKLSSPIGKLSYAVPVLSQHAQVVADTTHSGIDITAEASYAASVAPYRSLRTEDGTINLDKVQSMVRPVTQTSKSLKRARRSLDRTESSWLLPVAAKPLESYRKQLDRAIPEADGALRALEAAPGLLGGNGTRHYLLLFANPAESRGMGGFIGAWAQLDAVNGHITLVRHGKMGELNDATDWHTRKITGEPEYLSRYSDLQPARFIQNISASPDFPTVARVAEQLYPQAGGQKVDGVFYIDPPALAALLKLTGPVKVEGIPERLTSSNAAKFLMNGQYTELPDVDDRTDQLSNAAEATFRALTSRPLPDIGTISTILSPMVHQRRLLLSVTNPAEQRFLASIGMTGAFPRADGGDLLSFRISNASANKADFYLRQLTQYVVNYEPKSGHTTSTATVTVTNNAPTSGEPAYVLGNQDTRSGKEDGRPFGSDTLQFSFYSALRPVSMTAAGQPVDFQVQRELGAWVSTTTLTLDPGERLAIRASFAGDLRAGKNYRLTIVPQATAAVWATTLQLNPLNPAGQVQEKQVKLELYGHTDVIRRSLRVKP